MDAETTEAIRNLADALRALSARIADIGARVAVLDHDLDALFERCADTDDDDETAAEHVVVIGIRYDRSTHRFMVLRGRSPLPVEPEESWAAMDGGQAVEESY